MTDVAGQVIGLVPVALAAGVLTKVIKEVPGSEKPRRAKARKKVKTHWKYHPVFKNAYLDTWYGKSPATYNQAHEACNKNGDEMIAWNMETNPELHKTIYGEATKETQQVIMDRRLE